MKKDIFSFKFDKILVPLIGWLITCFITLTCTYADELSTQIRYFSFVNNLPSQSTSFFAGEFLASNFSSDTKSLRLNLNEKNPLKGSLSVENNFLKVETSFFSLDFNLDEIPFYTHIRFINLIGLSYYQTDDMAAFDLDRIHLNVYDYEVFYRNLKGKCERLVGQDFSFIDSCLNNSKIETLDTDKESALGRVRTENLSLDFTVQELSVSERQILFSTNNLDLVFKKFKFQTELLRLRCAKKIYDEQTDDKILVKDCLFSGDISMSMMKFSEEDIDLSGELSVKSFLSNQTKMTFVSDALSVNIGESHIAARMILAECKTPKLTEAFEYIDIPYSCIEESAFKMGGFTYADEDVEVSFDETSLRVDENKVALVSPLIKVSIPSENLNIAINNADIICDKLFQKDITAENVLQGCFNSSRILISRIDISHPIIDSDIKIETIMIDKNSIHLQSSRGGYEFNDLKNKYKDLDFRCGLNASYELAKNLDWKSLLKNCLHESRMKLDSLTSLYNGSGFFKKIWSKLESWGIQGVKGLDFDSIHSNKDEFVMDISPSIIGFIPTGGRVFGNINYDEEKNQIKIKVRNFKFYKIIPAKAVLMFILSAFVADESTDVNGDIITISLE